jgi:hypothetical protein
MMDQHPRAFLICGTIRGPGSQQAICSQCAATIWPTSGSLERAQMQKMPMICLDCFQKIDDFEFAGFMHHGSILPQDLSEKLFVEMELALQKKPGVA